MKIGSFLLILLIVTVSLGFLLKDSIDTHADLAAANNTILSLQTERDELANRVVQQSKHTDELTAQNQALQNAINVLESRIAQDAKEMETLRGKNLALESRNSSLQSHVVQLEEKVSVLSTEITWLSTDEGAIQMATLAGQPVEGILGVIVLVALIGACIAVYRSYHVLQRQGHPRMYSVKVSRMELDMLQRHRRKH
jgi:hypothetical protein